MEKFLLVCFSVVTLQVNLFAQAGKLDSTFGHLGIVTTFIDSSSIVNCVEVQPDGKIVAGGWSSNGIPNATLSRYMSEGNLDSTFGTNGIAISHIDSMSEIISITLQSDGKIIAGGWAAHSTNIYATVGYGIVARFNANGSLDTSFNHNGIFTYRSNILSHIWTVSLQNDGKILAGGFTSNPGSSNSDTALLLRIDNTGILSYTFGNNGRATFSPISNAFISSIAIQTDNKILALGTIDYNYFALARYNSNGTPDNTFGINGFVKDSVNGCVGNSFKIQTDGKLIAAGTINFSYGMIRYLSNGIRDSTFGINGLAQNPDSLYPHTGNEGFLSSALQSDGKILAGGVSNTVSGYVFEVVRYNINGWLDSTFGENGRVNTFIDTTSRLNALSIQTDGKIIAGGWSSKIFNYYGAPNTFGIGMALARYMSGLNTGIIDFAIDNNNVYIYPNPIRETETLTYTLKTPESITITLQDMEGRQIKTFTENEKQDAGEHKLSISMPHDLASGTYIISISSPAGHVNIKVVR